MRDHRPDPSRPPRGKITSYRGFHRSKSHADAHAGAHEEPPPPILDHPLVPKNDPPLVTAQPELAALIERLRASGSFAYDSEFIGEQTYYPHLCVIQVATPESVALIDPLEPLNLLPFWELLADPAVEKVVHAGTQDLEPVYRHLGRTAQNVFDIQIASGFVGLAYPSALGKIATALAGADLGRGTKFSQWDHRPLTLAQMRYAANDVRYLPLIRRVIGDKLKENGREAWAAEESARLSDPGLYRFDASAQRLRVRGVEQLSRRQRATLRELMLWRDQTARKEDVPPRALLRDDVLYALAKYPAESVADLDRIRGLPRPVEERYGAEIVERTGAALEGPLPEQDDDAPPPDHPEFRSFADEAWIRVQALSLNTGIDTALVTTRREVTAAARAVREGRTETDPSARRLLTGWRGRLVGEAFREIG